MVNYIAAGSSVSTIDFAAGLIASKIFRNSKIQILINEFPELPTNTTVRHLVSRASLPMCMWSHDNSGTWRQHFLPLELIRAKRDFSLSLKISGDTYKRHLFSVGNEYQANRIGRRIDKIIKSIASVRHSDWANWSLYLTEYIYNAVGNQQIKSSLFGKYRNGLVNDKHCIQFLKRMTSYSFNNCKSILPKKGGRIELSIDLSSFDKFEKLTTKKNEIIFINKQSSINIADNKLSNMKIRYRGPLEIGLLQELGTLMHLPWYSDADFSVSESDPYLGREFISSISVASNHRASAEVKGGNFRLYPLGYSLLEFDNETVLAIVQNIFKDISINYNSLCDFRTLLWEFPISRQKLAKNQKAAATFRSNQENKILRSIKSEEFGINDLPVINHSKAISKVELGSLLCKWLGLLRALKQFASPKNDMNLPKKVQKHLVNLNLIDQNNFLLSGFITEQIRSVISDTISFLISVGFNPINATKTLKEFDTRSKEIEDKVLIPMHSSSTDPWVTSLAILIPVIRESADLYYQFASFICANIFKASLFQAYILLGSDGYNEFIEYLLDERSSRKYINYRPILWS